LSLEGIGARLTTENDYTKVAEIIPGGPADKAKTLHANDLISGVAQGKDGEMVDVVGWRLDEVVKLIKGPKGTEVRLQVLPAQTGINGPPIILSFIREKVKLEDQAAKKKVVNYSMNGKNIKLGVVSLPSFYMDFAAYQKGDPNYRSTTRDVKRILQELKSEGVQGVVVDLRNNGGGSLPEAIDLTGLFIKEGPVVQVRDPANRVEAYVDDNREVVYDGPLVVLTNRFSASASEIFAGAMKFHRRALIVGDGSTFGKGTVQNYIELSKRPRAQPGDEDSWGTLRLSGRHARATRRHPLRHRSSSLGHQCPEARGVSPTCAAGGNRRRSGDGRARPGPSNPRDTRAPRPFARTRRAEHQNASGMVAVATRAGVL
jgi:carboxyl-terminal processing protease